MLFNSINFLVFLIAVIVVYYATPSLRWRKVFLLAASYYFYACWNVAFLSLLLAVTALSYVAGRMMAKPKWKERRKIVMQTSVVFLLLPLLVFKYLDFLMQAVQDAVTLCGLSMSLPSFQLLLPVGISFFTFMAIGYVADVYLEKIEAERNVLDFALFIGFFPQIASGPIGRAPQLLPQLKQHHPLLYENLAAGLKMMLWGFFMKLVVGDRAGIYVDTVFGNYANHNGGSLMLATFMYSIQIYCDFAGYSLIAIGTARTMGYRLMTNFERPYLAVSVADFWHRWHISLSTWFRDYVYIPCGGSRVGKAKTYRNILITFLVSGLWHGAAYTFIFWGGYHGVAQVIGKMTKERRDSACRKLRVGAGVRKSIDIVVTFAIVSYGWMIFYAPDFHTAFEITKGYFSLGVPYIHQTTLVFFALGFLLLLAKDVADEYLPGRHLLMNSRHVAVRYVSFAILAVFILLTGVLGGGQFIYFKF